MATTSATFKFWHVQYQHVREPHASHLPSSTFQKALLPACSCCCLSLWPSVLACCCCGCLCRLLLLLLAQTGCYANSRHYN